MSAKQSVDPAREQDDTPETIKPSRQAHGHLVAAVRHGDRKGEIEARRNLAASKIAEAIDKALAKAPKLTNAQVVQLTRLLQTRGERQTRGAER